MRYCKIVTYGNYLDVYKYEKYPMERTGKGKGTKRRTYMQDLALNGIDSITADDFKERRKSSAQRAELALRRLILCNVERFGPPVFLTLTYAENQQDIRRGNRDLRSFTQSLRYKFGKDIKYIAVPEFQRRGAVHYHIVIWGLSESVVRHERSTRVVAGIWGRGFIEMRQCTISEELTEGKLANYLSKYITKAYLDKRYFGVRCYMRSLNLVTPKEECGPSILANYVKEIHNISTVEILSSHDYMTKWMGKGRYQLIKISK